MFAAACSIARNYTRPVIVLSRLANGDCRTSNGTFVIINSDGWFVTANHIIEGITKNQESISKYNDLQKQRKTVEDDTSIKTNEKFRRLKALKIPDDLVTHEFVLWGMQGLSLRDGFAVPEVDLFVGQLLNFDPTQIQSYPIFKDPSQPMEQGKSLCKLGYPFFPFQPAFDANTNTFTLPTAAFSPPEFPIEGIFTRKIPRPINPSIQPARTFPLTWLETSSPGIPGQSGGPTFDTEGVIWAIQSSTGSYNLNFGNSNQTKKQNEFLENQYLHVGLGVHTETLTAFLTENGISFQMSRI